MNLFIFSGRATKDAELSVRGDLKIARVSLAVDRFKKDDPSDFFQLTLFDKKADFADKYVKQGKKYIVKGRVQNNNYEDKEGKKHYQNSFIVDEIEFCEKKNSEDAPKENFDTDNEWMNIPDNIGEELPFN